MNGNRKSVRTALAATVAATVGLAALAMLLVGGLPYVVAANGDSRGGAPAATEAEAEAKRAEQLATDVTQGALRVVKPDGEVVECPLKHTDVKAEVSGFIARVKVTQTFFNPLDEKIEAVYVFPLPHQAAVDDMTMVYSSGRRIVGIIKRRDEARAIYEQAIAEGATAALLEQERPNIFTQTVGNIKPKEEIRIEIAYVDVLSYDRGTYEFHFPMVVGPRYIPGAATSDVPPVPPELKDKVGEIKDKLKDLREIIQPAPGDGQPKADPKGTGWAPDTDRVPDASRITPPVLKPGFRNGHDISLSVTVDAGVPIRDLKVINHAAQPQQTGPSTATVALGEADSIPNKDFVLRYGVVGEKPEMALLTHTDGRGAGYFMLMIQPKLDERLKQAPPREIVFLIDVSGSMSGEPTDQVRQTMAQLLRKCNPGDTVQVVTFASESQKLFEAPVPVTEANIKKALAFTDELRGSGGTEMLKGVKMALDEPADPQRVRIVLMLTDGFIGNEAEIIAEVGRRAGDRVRFWCLGIGESVNRFLVDGVARQGGGMGKVLSLRENPAETVEEIMMRIHRAQLSKIAIDWGGVQVTETYPARIPELWAERPVILFGRYVNPFSRTLTTLTVSGNVEGQPAQWPLAATFPPSSPRHEVLAKVWARQKIEDLMQQTYYAGSPEVEQEVTQIALDYRLMSQYTSFVAVDEAELNRYGEPARPPRRMLVPVPIPEGTRYEGFFGEERELELAEVQDGIFGAGGGGGALFSAAPAATAPAPAERPRGVFTLKSADSAGRVPQRRHAGFGPGAPTSGRTTEASPDFGRIVPQMNLSGGLSFSNNKSLRGAYALSDGDELNDLSFAGDVYNTWFPEQQAAVVVLAVEKLAKAEALAKDDAQLASARQTAAYAYLLSAALGSDQTAAKATETIASIDERLLKQWTAAAPALDKKLDLVIRDKSVGEALAELATASGLTIRVTGGSERDAAAMLAASDARVTWLDLRRATVAQALDWTLQPLRLQWQLRDGGIVVASARRAAEGAAPWVYDVSLLAGPSAKELEKIKDHEKKMAAVRKDLAAFITAVRAKLGLGDEAIVWYGPSQVLVFADAAKHAEAAKLLADLADPAAKFDGDLAKLHAVTSQRATERQAAVAKSLTVAEQQRVADALQAYAWRLLADAAAGRTDDEAMTELAIAWRSPQVPELLKNERAAALMLRSLWILTESSKALPQDKPLAAMALHARDLCRAAAAEAVQADAEELSQDYTALLRLVYAALALRDDGATVVKAGETLGSLTSKEMPFGDLARAGLALVGPAEEIDVQALAAMASRQLPGEDLVVLSAMACRRAGGAAWTQFRAESRTILGDQELPGGVVVLVNRLAEPHLPLVAAK
ncbi:MAG TPA: VIT domain-containing protein [Phycisphaerae bacterium]|nr:VIT domain-containing protein [Phycisphaerae bacterium]